MAQHCNDCGTKLDEKRASKGTGRLKLHADTAHPINSNCREEIQNKVLEAYKEEVEKSKTPGYKPQKYEDMDDVDYIGEELNEDVDQEKSGK